MYTSPTTENFSELEFEFSRSPKVNCVGAIGLPIYGLQLMFNSNIWPKLYYEI